MARQGPGPKGSFRGEGAGSLRCPLASEAMQRDPTQCGAPSRVPGTLTTPKFETLGERLHRFYPCPFHEPLTLLSALQFREKCPRVVGPRTRSRMHQIHPGKKGRTKAGGQTQRGARGCVAGAAGKGDFQLVGGGSGRQKLLLPPPPPRSYEQRGGAGPLQKQGDCAGDKPWAPWSRTRKQGADATLSRKSLCSHRKVQQVQNLVTHDQQFPEQVSPDSSRIGYCGFTSQSPQQAWRALLLQAKSGNGRRKTTWSPVS